MDIIQEAKELTYNLYSHNGGSYMVPIDQVRYMVDLISRLVDRLEEQQWQPIESAPKDGTEILGCNVDGEIEIIWLHGKEWQARDLSRFDAIKWLPLPPIGDK